MKLRDWQVEAINVWKEKKCKGTLKVCTGAGKTVCAIQIIKEEKGKVLIVVPTIQLLKQWVVELKKHIKEDIGVYYGQEKKAKRITVAVINSLRNKKIDGCALLVLDECHRYQNGSAEKFLLHNNFKNIIGLSATPEKITGMNGYILKIAPIIYEYGKDRAIADGVLANYKVINLPVSLAHSTRKNYNYVDYFIKRNFRAYSHDFNVVLARSKAGDSRATEILYKVNERKEMVYKCLAKKKKAVSIIKENLDKKIIVFDERIANVDEIKEMLAKEKIKCFVYHSKLKPKVREEVLEKFERCRKGVLLTAKCLDEGYDIKSANAAIIVNGSSSSRQSIQRLGRVLRIEKGKIRPIIYQIYVSGTVDEKWMRAREI